MQERLTAPLINAVLSALSHAGDREKFGACKQKIRIEQKNEKDEFRTYTDKMNREWKDYPKTDGAKNRWCQTRLIRILSEH